MIDPQTPWLAFVSLLLSRRRLPCVDGEGPAPPNRPRAISLFRPKNVLLLSAIATEELPGL